MLQEASVGSGSDFAPVREDEDGHQHVLVDLTLDGLAEGGHVDNMKTTACRLTRARNYCHANARPRARSIPAEAVPIRQVSAMCCRGSAVLALTEIPTNDSIRVLI